MKREMEILIAEVADEFEMNETCSTMKSYLRVREKWP